MCYELLNPRTVKTIFLPIIEAVPKFLENLTDDELKKEAKNESKNDTISAIVKNLKSRQFSARSGWKYQESWDVSATNVAQTAANIKL